ncbi:hypothetical protein BDK51DRAFT_48832 [Blyttiomyces helicus]|uniref:Uncharacterized protein n=1 Tax=Blyttiomyces helicus TaxID=388810 RepID=A0A4P9W318_9FUNG|nr:hypothetical protein BDK51DRAFT_48832 [Blyttiomyces helicus]|eukprot:RKO85593.1 hypothetical protein BDK51DRAFT_48832 [Blyttiomyces helicus]
MSANTLVAVGALFIISFLLTLYRRFTRGPLLPVSTTSSTSPRSLTSHCDVAVHPVVILSIPNEEPLPKYERGIDWVEPPPYVVAVEENIDQEGGMVREVEGEVEEESVVVVVDVPPEHTPLEGVEEGVNGVMGGRGIGLIERD